MSLCSKDCSAVCLVGGQGRRMGGVVKPLLLFNGVSLLEHILATVQPWCCQSFLVFPKHLQQPFSPYLKRYALSSILDPGLGPKVAVLEAATLVTTPWILLLAGDQPLVSSQMIAFLLQHTCGHVDAVCFEFEGRLQPFLACYQTASLLRLRKEPSDGATADRSLKSLLSRLHVQRLQPPGDGVSDSFFDVDTRADQEKLLMKES